MLTLVSRELNQMKRDGDDFVSTHGRKQSAALLKIAGGFDRPWHDMDILSIGMNRILHHHLSQ